MTNEFILLALRSAAIALRREDCQTTASYVDDIITELEARWVTVVLPDTVRVRIAAIVDRHGYTGACGCDLRCGDGSAMEEAYERTKGGPEDFIAQAFIEADIPRIPTVQGRTVESESGSE
jgi:hypothetical protein